MAAAPPELGCAVCMEPLVARPIRLVACCSRTVCADCLTQMLALNSSECCFCRVRLLSWVRRAGGIAALVDPRAAAAAATALLAAAAPIEIGDGDEEGTAPPPLQAAPPRDAAAAGEVRRWFAEESARAAGELRHEHIAREISTLRLTLQSGLTWLTESEAQALRGQMAALLAEQAQGEGRAAGGAAVGSRESGAGASMAGRGISASSSVSAEQGASSSAKSGGSASRSAAPRSDSGSSSCSSSNLPSSVVDLLEDDDAAAPCGSGAADDDAEDVIILTAPFSASAQEPAAKRSRLRQTHILAFSAQAGGGAGEAGDDSSVPFQAALATALGLRA